jgi:hypothetical protein
MSAADRSTLRLLACAGAIAVVAACAKHTAPPGFLSSPSNAGRGTQGGWLDLELSGNRRLSGELLAVTAESLWVLGSDGRGMVVPRSALTDKGSLTRYRATSSEVAGLTAAGVALTISNGAFLLITAPLWVLTGTISGSADGREAQTPVRPAADRDSVLRAFSRFPQGLPRGFDVSFARLSPAGSR